MSGSGVGVRVGADQYAADTISLKSIVDELYQGFQVKPLVLAPGGFFDANWYTKLIDKTKPNSLNVITHHIYNLGPGIYIYVYISASYMVHGSLRFLR